jgi:dUTP pyrophosphatase
VKLYYANEELKPRYKEGDAGIDLRANERVLLQPGDKALVSTGVSWADVPSEFFAYITGRSGMNAKALHVHQGVIDSSYRGEWKVVIQNLGRVPVVINKGDRIAQAVILRHWGHLLTFEEGQAPLDTERADGGFGSTGR